MSLADRLKNAVSGEFRAAVGDTFSSSTLRDALASAVNAGTESFRRKAASRLAATPEVDRAGSRIGAERVRLFLSQWGVPLLIVGAVLIIWRTRK